MNLNLFYYVVEIEKCRSINRAAQNLYISQSNMSASIKALETELGFRLFNRSPQGISPTPEGYLFLQSAKAIISEVNRIGKIPEMLDAHSDISISCAWSSRILQCFLDYKQNDNRNIRDSFKETGLIQSYEDIQENRYRLGIFYCFHSRTAYYQQVAKKTNLITQPLKTGVDAVAVMSVDHPLAGEESITLRKISQYPLALFEGFDHTDWTSVMKVDPSQRFLYLYDRGAIMDAVADGNSISLTMRGTIRQGPGSGIVEVPISDLDDSLDIFLLKHIAYELNDREQGFINRLVKVL